MTLRTRAVVIPVLLVLTFLTTACETSAGRSADLPRATTPDLADLVGTTWTASAVSERPLVDGSTVSLHFMQQAVSANAGCNTLRGAAEIEDTELVVGELASTRMGCEPKLAAQDAWLASFLTSRPEIESLDDDLWLRRGDTALHLVRAAD